MKYALINPRWHYEGSIYFGCRAPHLPLELGYARALLEQAGHQTLLLDAGLEQLSSEDIRGRVQAFAPDITVIPTAPSYLFWRCPPPELRVPRELLQTLEDAAGLRVLIGPHSSTTPGAALRKTGADIAVLGESEEVLVHLATDPLHTVAGIAWLKGGRLMRQGGPRSVDLARLPALHWPRHLISGHAHHHHRFDTPSHGLGAEIEASRGCPYACSFCAKADHRDRFRRRPLDTVLKELDGLLDQGVGYVYFIDEIFLPERQLLHALRERPVQFGVQTRIDLWKPDMLELLGEAGCVSVEAGVESISEGGRKQLDKHCRLTTAQLSRLLILARRGIPFVQASLLDGGNDDPALTEIWRQRLNEQGVWANKPVPLFPYPGSPDYRRRWGPPDDFAWERAVDHYLTVFAEFSDIQEQAPRPLIELECDNGGTH
ncbi:MAG: TIGR04295 family B12-binding domain-containing radical SAM protein [Aquisalimonadaceae bacterium]